MSLAGGQCVYRFCRRHGLITASAGGAWKSEPRGLTAAAESRRRNSHPVMQQISGVINSSNKGFNDASERSGRFGERKLYILRLRGPDHVHGERLRRHELRDADVGRVHCAGEPTVGGNGDPTIGFINPTILRTECTSSYATDFPRTSPAAHPAVFGCDRLDLVTGWGSPNGVGLINALNRRVLSNS